MTKKQFNLEDWLKYKSQKVVTRCGFPVRIVCTDVKRKDYPILALVERDDQEEYQSFTKDGRFSLYNSSHDSFDLFIETVDEVSEDEKVRKWCISHFKECINVIKDNDEYKEYLSNKVLAWLEKQGEKPADKVEPKFKVGDKIRRKTPSSFDKDMQVARIEKDYYVCNHIGKFSSEVVPFSKQSSYELVEPKQGWRAEDEAVLDALIRRLKGEDIYVSPHLAVECLESLKGRVLPKQEWSEEDEQHIDSLLKRLDALCRIKLERTRFAISEDIDWLKSLRPLKRWKPSDEHISLLQAIINEPNNAASESCQIVLKDILEQLKKLKEGKV